MSPGDLAERVAALLAHYWTPDLSDREDVLMMKGWVQALGNVPAWAVQEAMDEWTATETRRPTPAAIRQIAMTKLEPVAAKVRKLDGPGVSRGQAMGTSWLKQNRQAFIEGWHVGGAQWVRKHGRYPDMHEAAEIKRASAGITREIISVAGEIQSSALIRAVLKAGIAVHAKRLDVYARFKTFHDLPDDPEWDDIDLDQLRKLTA